MPVAVARLFRHLVMLVMCQCVNALVVCAFCRELPQLRTRIKQMEDEKERLAEKVEKAAAQAAGRAHAGSDDTSLLAALHTYLCHHD